MSKEALIEELRAVLDRHGGLYDEAGRVSDFVSEWRSDGFSVEPSEYGARRHIAIEDALDELREGDEYARQVAESADRWLAFDVDGENTAHLAPQDADLSAIVREAHNNSWGVRLMFSRAAYHAPFKLKLPPDRTDALANRYFEFVDGHAFVHNVRDPEQYAEDYAQSLLAEAAELRRRAKEADAGIVRPV